MRDLSFHSASHLEGVELDLIQSVLAELVAEGMIAPSGVRRGRTVYAVTELGLRGTGGRTARRPKPVCTTSELKNATRFLDELKRLGVALRLDGMALIVDVGSSDPPSDFMRHVGEEIDRHRNALWAILSPTLL